MQRETGWAPILFGRTLARDFRFITYPSGFNTDDLRWAEKWILGAMQDADLNLSSQLSTGSRYAVVVERNRTLIGRVALHSDLYTRSGSVSYDRDQVGRPLYCFSGFVASTTVDVLDSIILLPPIQPGYFCKPFQQYLMKHWEDRTGTPGEQSGYTEPLPTCLLASCEYELNWNDAPDRSEVFMFPGNESEAVWAKFAASRKTGSLATGFATMRDALISPFLNVCVREISAPRSCQRKTVKRQENNAEQRASEPASDAFTDDDLDRKLREVEKKKRALMEESDFFDQVSGFLGRVLRGSKPRKRNGRRHPPDSSS